LIGLDVPVHSLCDDNVALFVVPSTASARLLYAYTVYVPSSCPPSSVGAENDTSTAPPPSAVVALTDVGADGVDPGDTPPYTSCDAYHVLPVTAVHCACVRFIGESDAVVPLFTQLPPHSECTLVPNAFVAVAVKRYHTPFVSPGTVTAVLSTTQRDAVHSSSLRLGNTGTAVADKPLLCTVYTPAHSHSSADVDFVEITTVSPAA
jgi:hypothetical protein